MSEMPGGFKVKVFTGELRGNGLSARCRVSLDEDGAACIDEVTPLLPDDDYELLVTSQTASPMPEWSLEKDREIISKVRHRWRC